MRTVWVRTTVAASGALLLLGAAPALADVEIVFSERVNGETVVDETVTVPTEDADATLRVANTDASTNGVCFTGLGISVSSPAPLARESGIAVVCVGSP